mmetsp:Transcript_3622/g.7645  ORF Transcript_3622/g.7645 Transcript_3622/m.7645 type:complete len:337 (-) Transcript_3622:33-1043(-)
MLLDLALASLALCPRTLRVSVHAVRATSTASLNPNAYAAATGPLTRLPCPVARRCESLTAMVMDDDAEQPTHTLDLRQPAGRQRPGPGAGGAKDFGRDPRPFLSELPTEEELGVNHWDHLDTEGPQPSPSEDGGGAACCVAGEGVRLRQLHALRSVAQLQLALQHADAEGGRPVVLKFFSPHCITCKSIKLKFERTVKATSNAIDFYEVDRVQVPARGAHLPQGRARPHHGARREDLRRLQRARQRDGRELDESQQGAGWIRIDARPRCELKGRGRRSVDMDRRQAAYVLIYRSDVREHVRTEAPPQRIYLLLLCGNTNDDPRKPVFPTKPFDRSR